MTGGIPSSYAAGAAAMAGNNYAAQLSAMIPQLEQIAYGRYLDEIGLNVQNVDLLNRQEQFDYSKFRDQLAQYNTNRSFEYGVHRDDIGNSQWQSEFDRALTNDDRGYSQWLAEFLYGQNRDAIGDARYEREYADAANAANTNNLLKTDPIRYWQQMYAEAQARGDQSGMNYAHAMAEAERAKLGYSGGGDGSQYIPLTTSSGTSGGGSSGSGSGSSGSSGSANASGVYKLFEEAYARGGLNAESYIKTQAKNYGFTTEAERAQLLAEYKSYMVMYLWTDRMREALKGVSTQIDRGNASTAESVLREYVRTGYITQAQANEISKYLEEG
jgi:uncharacterized membrane protein